MPEYSIIVPVYNRPGEVEELLESLESQTFKDFEVIVVEDGSTVKADTVFERFKERLNIRYYFKENEGQGFARNFGAELAAAEWLIFFDSDCVIPSDYFSNLDGVLSKEHLDAFSGPDMASPDFSDLQKAISYSMTSFFTTGGIRGKKVNLLRFIQLRSYNMGVRVGVWQRLGGFRRTNMGEDMEFSFRFKNEGFHGKVIQGAYVYHKRRNTLASFYKQVFSFGQTRIQLRRHHLISIKAVHLFPMFFVLAVLAVPFLLLPGIPWLTTTILCGIGGYFCAIFLDSSIQNKKVSVGFLSLITSFVQLSGYGLGFIYELAFGAKRYQAFSTR